MSLRNVQSLTAQLRRPLVVATLKDVPPDVPACPVGTARRQFGVLSQALCHGSAQTAQLFLDVIYLNDSSQCSVIRSRVIDPRSHHT
jgi:hypothetical protein